MSYKEYLELTQAQTTREGLYQRMQRQQVLSPLESVLGLPLTDSPLGLSSALHPTNTTDPQTAFETIKKSVKEIEAEPFTGEVRQRVEQKIGRLQSAGATNQALILEQELQTRDSLVRLKEWDYKLLSQQVINDFEKTHRVTMTADGLKVHIDLLETYIGNPQNGEAKDRIIPDEVLDKLEEAKTRELFDGFKVLWAERFPDPLLLGCVEGCKDYFLIAEWDDDISFEQIINARPAES